MTEQPPRPDDVDPALIDRYLSDEMTSQDGAIMAEHRLAAPDAIPELDMVQTVAQESAERGRSDIDTQWARFTGLREGRSIGAHRPLHRPRHMVWPFAGMVAALVVVFGGGLWLGVRRPVVQAGRAYVTAPGQRLTVTLVDGTQLTLAPESRLSVPMDYRLGDRTVTLSGEAYFAVVHDTEHPFAVRAGLTTTRDIGTAFDVRAYPADPDVRVTVAEGVVAVGTATLHAGDVANVSAGHMTLAHYTDVAALTAWSTGTLIFDNAPLPTVLAELSRWYGVRIVTPDVALATHHVTLRLVNPTLTDMLHDLADALGARIERRADTVVLTSSPVSAVR